MKANPFQTNLKIILLIATTFIISSCEHLFEEGNLNINNIEFKEVNRTEILELPNGTFIPDNPNFDFNKPETWTGNMAEYVRKVYFYEVSYQIENTGYQKTYDAEIDLYYTFNSGDEKIETVYIGDVRRNDLIDQSTSVISSNRQLVEVSAEVFWFDDY